MHTICAPFEIVTCKMFAALKFILCSILHSSYSLFIDSESAPVSIEWRYFSLIIRIHFLLGTALIVVIYQHDWILLKLITIKGSFSLNYNLRISF